MVGSTSFSSSSHSGPTIIGSKTMTTEVRKVADFTRVSAGENFAITYKVGPTSVKIDGDDNIVPLVRTDVVGDELKIDTGKNYSVDHAIKITLTSPKLEGVTLSGAARMKALGVEAKAFQFKGSGASLLEIDGVFHGLRSDLSGATQLRISGLEGGRLTGTWSGAAQVTVTGRIDEITLALSGAAQANLLGLTAQEANVDASGGSMADLNVKKKLHATASGGSNIAYIGHPGDLSVESSGGSHIGAKH